MRNLSTGVLRRAAMERLNPSPWLIKENGMSIRTYSAAAGVAALVAALGWAAPSEALSMKECSAKYRAARSAGTLGGLSWNEFRRAQCAAGGQAAAPTIKQAPAAGAGGTNPGWFGGGQAQQQPRQQQPSAGTNWWGGAPKYSFGSAVFPQGISPKYAGMSAGKARMHTCLDQYRVNKASGGNANLKWIQRGGGYYSQCNRQLKGQ
jgi:hypothetical protein